MKHLSRILLLLLSSWIVLAVIIYRFRHPEQTETQLFLNTPKAMLFNSHRPIAEERMSSQQPGRLEPSSQPDPDPEWWPSPDKPLRPQLAIYAASEPRKAAALALRMTPTGEDGDEAIVNDPLGTVLRVWAQIEPDAAIAFQASLKDPERQRGAAVGLVDGLAGSDTERAIAWVDRHITHPDSVAFISLVVPHMQSPRAARWIENLPLKEEARDLLGMLAEPGALTAEPPAAPPP